MAYADQQGMSTGRIVSIALVLLLHAFLGYALVTGLAYEAVKNVQERLEVLDIEEEKPPEEEPPPPPPEDVYEPPAVVDSAVSPFPPPPGAPPPPPPPPPPAGVQCPPNSIEPSAPSLAQCRKRPDQFKCWNGQLVEQPSQCPKEPEPEKDLSKPASPKNNKASWVTTNDYPSRSLSREEEGTSRLNMTVGPDGRVTGCSASGATAALDAAACQFASRRARFNPALGKDGRPTTGSYSTSVRWQIPKE